MWRKPDYQSLDAPPEMMDLIHESIYYNSEGNLKGSSTTMILQYFFITLLVSVFLSSVASYIISVIFSGPIVTIFSIILFVAITGGLLYYLYKWGWDTYKEAWYHFDEEDEIFTVIQKPENSWEIIEMPYEQIHAIEWVGHDNGKAIIQAADFSFSTNRAKDKRFSSVTEIWDKLARIDTKMKGWPIELYCQECEREFGHHIGTARCPFDGYLLIDPDVKGRIDPEEQHPDDLDRI